MTPKEMKEVNKRLVLKLPENKPKEDKKETQKGEYNKRKEMLNTFNEKLKKSVLNTGKNNI